MQSIEQRLHELGVVLPIPATPVANYVPFVIAGSLLFISGQGPAGLLPEHCGRLGATISPNKATESARLCAVNVLAQAKAALGTLDRIKSCVRLGGFINATPDATDLPAIMNGASDLMVDVFGQAGRHARTTVGVAALPMNFAVEVEAVFEIAP